MAHELAHVQNRDTLTMTITATLAGAISMLGNFAFFFGGNRDNNNGALGIVGVLVAMIVAPLAAAIVQMAISRTREYAADRRGAEICDNPLWLASALDKIARNVQRIHNDDAERNPATAHLFIINPLSGERMDNLFSTHPEHARTASRRCKRWRRNSEALQGRAPAQPRRGRRLAAARSPRLKVRGAAPAPTAGRGPAPAASEQSMGPQSDRAAQRTQRPVVVSGTPAAPARDPGAANSPHHPPMPGSRAQAGLAVRMAAARLLAAVIDARTPLDGLTDHDHGHPQFGRSIRATGRWSAPSWSRRCAIAAASRR